MSGFVKIYGTILDSSIWSTGLATRVVWITVLAMADRSGLVAASVDGLARRANVTDEECRLALEVLQAPDPQSKSRAHRGRRVKRVDGGWQILNYARYRELRTEGQVAEAEKKARYRTRKRAGLVSGQRGQSTGSTVEAEAEAEGEKERTTRPAARADITFADLMGLVRTHLYVPDGNPPADWDAARDGSILKALRKQGYDFGQIAVAIEGLAIVRDEPGRFADEVGWLRRGEKVTLRALYESRSGVLPMFAIATQAYWKRAEARRARPAATARDPGGRNGVRPGPVSIADVLQSTNGR